MTRISPSQAVDHEGTAPGRPTIRTSNPDKLAELRRFGLDLDAEPADDLPEVDADPETVAVRKAEHAGPGRAVEDTVVEIDGAPVVDVKYRLDELRSLGRTARAAVIVTIAHHVHARDGSPAEIRVHRGRTEGVLDPFRDEPPDAFGFDPWFVPDGADGLSLHDLERAGRKDAFNARRLAAEAFAAGRPAVRHAVADVPPWRGCWQGCGATPGSRHATPRRETPAPPRSPDMETTENRNLQLPPGVSANATDVPPTFLWPDDAAPIDHCRRRGVVVARTGPDWFWSSPHSPDPAARAGECGHPDAESAARAACRAFGIDVSLPCLMMEHHCPDCDEAWTTYGFRKESEECPSCHTLIEPHHVRNLVARKS